MDIESVKANLRPCCKQGVDWYEIDKTELDWLIAEVERLREENKILKEELKEAESAVFELMVILERDDVGALKKENQELKDQLRGRVLY